MLPDRFKDYTNQVNKYLERILPPEDADPQPLYKAIRYSVFAGGKRMRPMLCLAAAESLGETPDRLYPVAAAIEMIHTYSLIHDDLPAMDNDDYRRGKLTNHKVFGEAMAILAGDALHTLALETISNCSYAAVIRCRLISRLTAAAGTHGMIGGQVLDIINENKALTRVQLEKMHGMKTAALIGFSAVAPALLLQLDAEVENSFQSFGESIGLAFQIVDDILDVESNTETLGKTAGKDQESHKATYPSILGLDESKRLATELIQSSCDFIAPYDSLGLLSVFARHVLERTH
jgi:geranylgeranyl diphosphate synthase, type II